MDREEFRIKLEEINKLVEKKDYHGAMEIVDSIDWRRVKNVRTLCVVGEIYAANKRYEDSKEIFLLAYHRAPIGKTILYRLIEVSIKMGDLKEAEEFYEEFLEVASNDNTRYILKYKIYSAKRAPLDEQIAILEEYKEHEYTERWAYELARLYYKAGEKEKCVETCDDLILWFNSGKYVTKALDLKQRMGVLTGAQKRQYEEALTPKLRTRKELDLEKEQAKEADYEDTDSKIDSIPIPKEQLEGGSLLDATGTFQEKIARGIKDIFSGKKKEPLSFEEEPKDESEGIEHMLGNQENPEDVPRLEPEENDEDLTSLAKEPGELKIPQSIRIPDPVKAPEPIVSPAFVPSQEEIEAALEADRKKKEELEAKDLQPAEEPEENLEETKNFDLNLEETILAAASAQGIEIPKEDAVSEEELLKEAAFEDELAEKEDSSFEEELAEFGDDRDDTGEDVSVEVEAESGEGDMLPEETEEPVLEEADQILDEMGESAEKVEAQTELETPEEEEEPQTEAFETDGLEEDVLLEKDEPSIEDLESKIIQFTKEEEKKKEAASLSEEELLEEFIDSRNSEPEANALYLIPREMKLNEEEKKLFTYFSSIPGIPDQLVEALADVQQAAADKTSKTGNVIIMGGLQTGKTRLSQGFILAACRQLHMDATKTANITGGQMNKMNPAEVVSKLAGGFLVIQEAAQMTADTIEQLNQAMEFRTDGLTVIIEDEKIGMRKLIAKYPKFAAKFTSMINIPVFTNDELVNFAKIYTTENGYVMDQMGVLALYNLIGDNQKEDEPMTIGKVKEMLDDAIGRAESGARKFKRNLSKKRTDEEGRVILYEKDFG